MVDFFSLLKSEKRKTKQPEESLVSIQDLSASADALLKRTTYRTSSNEFPTYQVGFGELEAVHYIPEFIDSSEETALISILGAIPEKEWVDGGGRRIINFGGQPSQPSLSENVIPQAFQTLCNILVDIGAFSPEEKPNHVLVNEYRKGVDIYQFV